MKFEAARLHYLSDAFVAVAVAVAVAVLVAEAPYTGEQLVPCAFVAVFLSKTESYSVCVNRLIIQ